MVLSDRDIKAEMTAGRIVIEPLDMEDVQPASVDVRLGSSFRVFRNSTHAYIDPTLPQPDLTEEVVVPEGGQFVLHPGQFVLGTTLERIAVQTRGQIDAGPPRPHDSLNRWLCRSGLGWRDYA